MKGIVVEAPGQVVLKDLEAPRPGPRDVLVRVAAAGICGSDMEIVAGTRPDPYISYPVVPGHEWAGIVEEVGSEVTVVVPGDAVVAEGFRSCGICDRCREGATNLCSAGYAETGFTHQGAFAELVSVPDRLVHRLPPGSDLSAAALLEPAACVAEGLLRAPQAPGAEVAVVGAGAMGLLAVVMLTLSSPGRLVLFDRNETKLALGRTLGADETLRIEGPPETLDERFDLVFEATGDPSGAALAVELARRGGAVILAGISGAAQPSIDADRISLGHLEVFGVFGASGRAWLHVVDLFSRRLLPIAPLVTHRLPLEDHARALALLGEPSAQAVKVQMFPSGGAA